MNKPTVSMIVAVDLNWAIGKDNTLPFNVPEDMKHFKQTTSGHAVIMGRKTWESLGKPLPNRTNIVLSRNTIFAKMGDVRVARYMRDAIKLAKSLHQEVFIIGGGEIYREGLKHADQIYLTRIGINIDKPDTYFPNIISSPEHIGDWAPAECLTAGQEFGSSWMYSKLGGVPYNITRYVRKTKD